MTVPHKRYMILPLLLLITAAFTARPSVVLAEASTSGISADQAICAPADDMIEVRDCLNAGPSARLQDLARQGITFPPEPIVAELVPFELSSIPFSYAQADSGEIPVYATLDDALNDHSTRKIPAGHIKYLSLIDRAETERGRFYQFSTSEWVSAQYVSKVGVPNFQGYLFKKNPHFTFGWFINEAASRSAPGYDAPETGKHYQRLNKVRVFESQTVREIDWVKIGPDEWVEHKNVALVVPNYTPPKGVTADRWIEVNLYEQVLTVYDKGNLVFATLISSGTPPFYTQPGVFQIYKMIENEYMTGVFEADRSDYYYLEDVPFIMYFDQARALHGAYWQTLLGYQRSHGCVNLSVADSHWLYDWAKEGDYVYVWDPSGKTPTDPSFYGTGGF